MFHYLHWFMLMIAMLALPTWARAEQVRYHYVPADACNTMTQVPAGPEGTIGELKRGYGLVPLPYPYGVRPNQMVTFRHAFNGKLVTIPLRLPSGPPRLEQRSDRIIYNYADYIVDVRFLPDGSVDVIYNSGFLRLLRFD
jgi:hypothetical protein